MRSVLGPGRLLVSGPLEPVLVLQRIGAVMTATVTPIRRRDRAWRKQANCLGADPSLFDDRADETPETRAAREDVAKDICATCPVTEHCLDFARRTRARSGIWAGKTYRERLAHFRDLRRAEREAAAAAELENAS
jgi:WhiB family transcriptional regulator, redox-sensing transcriptional regulator